MLEQRCHVHIIEIRTNWLKDRGDQFKFIKKQNAPVLLCSSMLCIFWWNQLFATSGYCLFGDTGSWSCGFWRPGRRPGFQLVILIIVQSFSSATCQSYLQYYIALKVYIFLDNDIKVGNGKSFCRNWVWKGTDGQNDTQGWRIQALCWNSKYYTRAKFDLWHAKILPILSLK